MNPLVYPSIYSSISLTLFHLTSVYNKHLQHFKRKCLLWLQHELDISLHWELE